jgi:hypothetical protein
MVGLGSPAIWAVHCEKTYMGPTCPNKYWYARTPTRAGGFHVGSLTRRSLSYMVILNKFNH